MWHAPYTHVIQGDYQLLMVESQIDTLTPGFSFSHSLCWKYSNGSCEPILDIYVSRDFQWYKKISNPMSFDPSNHSLKILESLKTPPPKVGTHLRVCGFILSHFPALLGVWMWLLNCTLGPHLSMPLALVTSPRLRLW